MVKYFLDDLDLTFGALSDPTRRAIVSRLAESNANVGDLARPFQLSLPAVSKHLRVLERAGLLHQVRKGNVRECQLVAAPLREAHGWIEQYRAFWQGQLDSMARYFETTRAEAKSK